MSTALLKWQTVPLDQLARDISYGFTTSATINGSGPRLLRITDIQKGDVDWQAVPFCAEVPPKQYLLERGDIVIARTGATTGKSFLIRTLPYPAVFASYLIRVRNNLGVIPQYLDAFFQSYDYWSQIQQVAKGTAQPGANASLLSKLAIPLAPLPEQRRIVAKIDSLSAKSKRARDHVDHIPRLVGKYKQALLAAAFRGDLTKEWRKINPRETWSQDQLSELEKRRKEYLQDRRGSRLRLPAGAASIPSGWFEAHLSDVGSLQVGYAYKSKWYSKHGIPLLRGANIAPGKVTWDDIVRLPSDRAADFSRYILNTGDIVIAMDRPIISTGLKVARIQPSHAGCLLVQRVARYVPSAFVENDFAWHLINSPIFIDHAVTQATGSDLPHISSNDILTTPLPLPVLTEQQEIVRLIEKAFLWIDRLTTETTNARKLIDHLDQAILAKAFRGELLPHDPNDEPASVFLERIRAAREVQASSKRKPIKKKNGGS
jgi:type I restriction enzyme, S subunit